MSLPLRRRIADVRACEDGDILNDQCALPEVPSACRPNLKRFQLAAGDGRETLHNPKRNVARWWLPSLGPLELQGGLVLIKPNYSSPPHGSAGWIPRTGGSFATGALPNIRCPLAHRRTRFKSAARGTFTLLAGASAPARRSVRKIGMRAREPRAGIVRTHVAVVAVVCQAALDVARVIPVQLAPRTALVIVGGAHALVVLAFLAAGGAVRARCPVLATLVVTTPRCAC